MREFVRSTASGGFTLLETAFYTILLGALGTPLVAVSLVSSRAVANNGVRASVEERNRALLYRLSAAVRESIAGAQVQNAGRTMRLTLPMGYSGAGVQPGDVISYEVRLATGETENGVDDNGNGLVDEARLVRTNLTTGETSVLGENLGFATSVFSLVDGTAVSLSMTNLGYRRDPDGNSVVSVSRQQTINPRN